MRYVKKLGVPKTLYILLHYRLTWQTLSLCRLSANAILQIPVGDLGCVHNDTFVTHRFVCKASVMKDDTNLGV